MRYLLSTILSVISLQLFADNKVCGKIDVGATYVHIDLLDNGKTVDRMDIPAFKSDACWAFWKGFCIKPTILWGSNDKELFITGAGLGHLIPLNKCLVLTPVVGFSYTYLTTTTSLPIPGFEKLSQKFYSYSPYVSLEATWNFAKKWRTYGQVQYAWSRNRNTIAKVGKIKEHSQGWNYALMLERDLNNNWSVQLGGGYNSSLSKEKRGVRAYGLKIGLARWF